MSIKPKYTQLTLFSLPKPRLTFFTTALVTLCNCLKKGDIEFEDFMTLLHNICEDYRKELQNVQQA